MEAKFLFFCLDREIGKVRNEFQHVAVGRRKNKDHGTAFPSMVFVGMMHHDAASCYHNACGLALYKLFWARHAPASAGAKKCRECLQQASPCLGWHWASAELMCKSRVSIDCLNVRLGAGTVLPVFRCASVCTGQPEAPKQGVCLLDVLDVVSFCYTAFQRGR